MELKSRRELENTRVKLERLESRYRTLQSQTGGDDELREVTMESLRRSINEFLEDTARFEARHSVSG